MPKKKPKLSIIAVHYREKQDLFRCLDSIGKSKTKTSYEIIVVDNDEAKTIDSELARRFPDIHYLKSPGNIGFGAGNNLGVKKAKGELLFFLNPDTLLFPNTIDILVSFLSQNKNAGIVAPLLVTQSQKPFELQGSMELTPLTAVFALTFINKYFPNNAFSQKYFLRDWDKKTLRKVDVVPGSAFVVRKDAFEKAGMFDEKMFLFFEEEDLCKRMRKLGYMIYMNPKVSVYHKWGKDKQETPRMKKIFARSRFYYFRKHFGLLSAIIVQGVCSL